MLVLAHVSDPHLDGTDRTQHRAERVMDHLRSLPRPVDAILVTGDIADHAEPDEYVTAARIFTAPVPVLFAPGNHDARAPMREHLLGEPPADEPVNRLHRVGDAVILMCDSTVPGEAHGELAPETVEWIDHQLTRHPDLPAFLAFHHPPVRMHHPLPDTWPLRPAADLAALLHAHPRVVAVLTGHAHTAAAATFADRPLLVAPAITWALRMPWEGDRPADTDAPPWLAYHVLGDDGSFVTHYRVVA
ncbi:metallophosphoesterase [Plantactinospora sp. GCM10030261]|uniref:metallophosphoesterase n=1 Tax=Plantactinospora sp. GCM10030261 TaxID=3273420 RepID=UPI003615FA7D